MKKIIPQTTDITQQNIDKIAQLFPQVVTEKEDENGNTTKAIDFELLKQHLATEIIEGSEERYRLDWPGKRASILKANTPITSTLKPDRESSVNFDTTENVYIEGDNFEVLKILQESYLGKIKMIYIDPPYNTGKDFVYKDNFKVSKDDYEAELGTEDEEGGKLFKNTDTNGRFHSDWLSMMYERLLVARDLLTDDGVIFMSIDDNEVHNLRKISDEVFGEENFIEIFNWAKTETPPNLSKKSKKIIEYILCYQKNNNSIKFKGLIKESLSSNGLLNQTNKIGILKFPKNKVATNIENGLISKGVYGTESYVIELIEDTVVKDNMFIEDVILKGKFKWTQGKLNEEINNGTIIKIPTIRLSPSYEKLEYDPEVPPNLINSKVNVGTNENAGVYLTNLMGSKIFDFPKPVDLIEYLINFNISQNDICLDFFSGSSSFAEAVLRHSLEEKIKFICVQYPEIIELKKGFSDSEKQITLNALNFLKTINKPPYITEIGKERIRRAGKKIQEDNSEKLRERKTPLDVGFRVYKTSESILKEVAKHPNEITQADLFASQDNIKEKATSEDILTSVILDFGLTLDNDIAKKEVAGSEIFMVDENALVACFDKEIDMQVVDTMANLKPLRAVFRDACFKDDKDLINTVESRFKQITPDTKVHVI